MWIKATQASVSANGTIITVNSGESFASVQPGDAAILGTNPPVEILRTQQAAGGAWQLVLEEGWPYAAVTNGRLRVQPNGGRFAAAMQAMRDVNTYAANTHAAMNAWLSSTAATISVEKADGSSISIPTLHSYTSNWGTAATRDVGTAAGNVMEVGAFGIGSYNKTWYSGMTTVVARWVNVCTATVADGVRTILTLNIGKGFSAGSNGSSSINFISMTGGNNLGSERMLVQGFVMSSNVGVLGIVASDNGNGTYEIWVKLPDYSSVTVNAIGNMNISTKIGVYSDTDPAGFTKPLQLIRNSINTTIDSNGFIKSASPIIKLFADDIDTNAQAAEQQPKFIKNGVGDYTITGTSGLAKEGWWIETPKDSNGNTKVIIQALEEIEQPDGTFNINIKTTEPRYGLDETGRLIGIGDPCDIPAGRWIDIRLQQLPIDTPEEVPAE
ncbi:hypothetical protein JYB87_12825 [Shewanella avicenniae]|uniref:Phage tail protein C-terminal domain-containing protein n=1 Tax=Shewanella avicenniae TaxID=2814294 RepID=A0ABX7QNP1_9GAMM|nr:hypothetical protein [Shewanella avicenniae]QSX32632.1 hypothetical protein JYB87_12825 [Shewanella avicenniae]